MESESHLGPSGSLYPEDGTSLIRASLQSNEFIRSGVSGLF